MMLLASSSKRAIDELRGIMGGLRLSSSSTIALPSFPGCYMRSHSVGPSVLLNQYTMSHDQFSDNILCDD